jgi:hypothetical protein
VLQVSQAELSELLRRKPYSQKDITTSKGKVRHTETPTKGLRRVHERLMRPLMTIEPPDFLFCPVKGRSQIDNALQHRDAREICTLDVVDYFPSTRASKVAWFFSNTMQCAPDVSAILAQLATKDGHIPTGSPLSPILAFYAFLGMWNEIARLAKESNCKTSVYVDDLTVSGEEVSGDLMWAIKRTIHGAGLRYHKVRICREAPAIVTGVVVQSGSLLLPHRHHQRSHETRTLMKNSDDAEGAASLERRLQGLMAHRNQVKLANSRP